MPTSPSFHMYPCGDHALTIELGDTIDAATNLKVLSLFAHLKNLQIAGVKDIIPAYHSITLIYDTLLLKKQINTPTAYEWVGMQVENAIENFNSSEKTVVRKIEIPVCYAENLAPDINELALLHALSIEEVIKIHCTVSYRVFMIGFLPGFAYMGSVDPLIATPRKASPRTLVPKGSVGIAGEQTGIYPFDSPGGWQIIGQTPLTLFDKSKSIPGLLQPGDEVQFYPITYTDFQNLRKS